MGTWNARVGISMLPPSRAELAARSKKYGVPVGWIDPRPRSTRWRTLYEVLPVLLAVAALAVMFAYLYRHHGF